MFTERKTDEIQSQKLQALGQLAGGIAHDFNNILSIIEGYARMLDKQNPGQDKIQQILTATKRGAALTRQLLAFGRQQILPRQQCDLGLLVRETDILLRTLVTHRIALRIKTPPEPVMVPCDPDMLSQILINLVANARDAIFESGTIWIDVTTAAQTAQLIVTDNGCGMESDIAARVYDPFFTTKPQGKGTGLGLSMAAGFMQQIGGSIEMKTAPGDGTSFTLDFPHLQAAQNILMPQAPLLQKPLPELGQKTILVVDDEEALLPILEMQLNELGMKVLKAANGDSALLMQQNYPGTIDLLLTDVVMPGISGVKLAEMLNAVRPDTGVVFMTGYPNRAEYLGAASPLPPGAVVLAKPLPPGELSPALQKALQRVQDMHDGDDN